MLRNKKNAIHLSHPLVRDAYLKKELGIHMREEDILVLEADIPDDDDKDAGFDCHLVELLSDLQKLKDQAEQKVGSIDRIDIRKY